MKKEKISKIYIIGIGGKGLNSIAEFCLSKGYHVSGSDCRTSKDIERLKNLGIEVFFDQTGIHVTSEYDVVVYSSIIMDSHPERVRAEQLGIKQISRAQFLQYITQNFMRISVAGSHGKSTTSALVTQALHVQEGAVNSIMGAYMKEYSSYQVSGTSPYCVVEACEYDKSFLNIPGDYTIITSLEKSHMEYFKTEQKMNDAFDEFISKHKPNSVRIINGDVPILRQISMKYAGHTRTCGFNHTNDYVIKNIKLEVGTSSFDLFFEGKVLFQDVIIKIPGAYNILNVALTLTFLHVIGHTNIDAFKRVLKNFTGVGRRFELSTQSKVMIIDDFAHHPTQVRQLIESIKQFYPDKKNSGGF